MKHGKLVLLAAALALAACEKQPQSGAGEKIASWASGYVSQGELDHALEPLGKIDPKQLDKVRAQALDELINQKLMYAAAEKSGLTKDPKVLLDEELAKRQAVARAYAQKLTASLAKPTAQEVGDYYNQNPQLFSQRRVYQLQEIRVQANPTQVEAVREQLGKSANLGELVNWLKAEGLPAAAQGGVKPAEQLPEALRDQLAKMNPGQAALLPTDEGAAILVVQAAQSQPVSLEKATPVIEQLIMARKQKEAIENDLKQLRDAAKIQYASAAGPAAKP